MDKLFRIPSLEDFKQVTDEVICNLYNVENQQTKMLLEEDINLAKTDIKKLILESNFDTDKLTKLLESKHYSDDKVSHLISSLKKGKTKLLVSTLIHLTSTYGETLQDFDWLLKLVLGTNELKTIKYPLVQLILLTVTQTEYKHRKVYDISKYMLDKMINVLENTINT